MVFTSLEHGCSPIVKGLLGNLSSLGFVSVNSDP